MSTVARNRGAALLRSFFIVLFTAMIVVAVLYPIGFGAALNTVITVTGGAPTAITLSIASVDYVQCASCTNVYQELQFGNTFQLGGQVTPANGGLTISVQYAYSNTQYNLPSYTTDSQGKYGWAQNNGSPNPPTLLQLKTDGFYVNGNRWSNSPSAFKVGDTMTVTTSNNNKVSNSVQIKIVGSGVVPTGTVTLKDGTGKTVTLDASSSVTAQSPLCFQVKITQGTDNVQSANLYYWVYGSTGTQNTAPLTKTPACGLPADSNSYYGTLTLQPNTYVVKVNIIPKQGQPSVLLSIVGYFGTTPPADYTLYYSAILGITGFAGLLSQFFWAKRKVTLP